jgi:2-polyprenyl-6-methoxyphenol hydroxylase-like FAD-dependent oxidoreductase
MPNLLPEQSNISKMTSQRPKLKVGIVGAGLGGLAAGVAIARAGADVTILEATKELGEIGAGIQVHPSTCLLWLSALDPDPILNRWRPMYHVSSSAGASTSSSATTSSSTTE